METPLEDISFISELAEAESIWIRTTESIDQLPDLSKLENIYEFGIQANPLKSLDGIERIPNRIRLVIGKVEDISALENIDPNKFFILMDERDQEAQPEIVQEIRDMGYEISADWGL
ncbi:hypothetical protein L21SP2_0982 [Salinispira pacifica]|uniref:Uncharacterized protein n=1 Tax=Salinispira pacifica TaxID=1307761 RepID=V5WFI1_9SPIO|nr:hypothetical protein L21SP2_0982 [Salinispira pacifica]